MTHSGGATGIESHDKKEIYRLTKERIVKDAKERQESFSSQILELDQIIKDFEATEPIDDIPKIGSTRLKSHGDGDTQRLDS